MVVLRLLGDACKLWAPGDRWGQKAAVSSCCTFEHAPVYRGWAVPACDSPLRYHIAVFGLGLSVTRYIKAVDLHCYLARLNEQAALLVAPSACLSWALAAFECLCVVWSRILQ